MSKEPKIEKPVNTFAVLVMGCEGKQVVATPAKDCPYSFLTLPCTEHHLPANVAAEFLGKLLKTNKQEVMQRFQFGIIQQRYVPRVYFHPFRIEMTKAELNMLAEAGAPLVKMSVPEEYHASVDRIHTDIFNSFEKPEAGIKQ